MIVLQLYIKANLDKYQQDLQDFLIKYIQDSNNEVRKRARMIFVKYAKIWPQDAHNVLYSVECSYQRVIIDECNQLGIDIENYVEASQDTMLNNSLIQNLTNLEDKNGNLDRSVLGQSLLLVSSNGNQI